MRLNRIRKVCHWVIDYIPRIAIQLIYFKPIQIAHNCVRFTIILQKALTVTCFGRYRPIVRQHDNCTELLHDILSGCL